MLHCACDLRCEPGVLVHAPSVLPSRGRPNAVPKTTLQRSRYCSRRPCTRPEAPGGCGTPRGRRLLPRRCPSRCRRLRRRPRTPPPRRAAPPRRISWRFLSLQPRAQSVSASGKGAHVRVSGRTPGVRGVASRTWPHAPATCAAPRRGRPRAPRRGNGRRRGRRGSGARGRRRVGTRRTSGIA